MLLSDLHNKTYQHTDLELSYEIFSSNTQQSVHSAPKYLEIYDIKL